MKCVVLVILFSLTLSASATTWYVRAGGGTRYSSGVTTGQCNGLADADYPGSGTNQACAYNDFRYLYDDHNGDAMAWVIAGGDTVIVRGCTALGTQSNPANPNCRIGWDQNNGTPSNNFWCYGVGSFGCYGPPIPAGTAGAHTRILGQNWATCNAGGTNPQNYKANLTQLFGGFGLAYVLNLQNTSYVDVQCLEITSHNPGCTSAGIPSSPRACLSSPPDDYGTAGILTNNQTANVNFQDVDVHGMNSHGFFGPIGGAIAMTRVFVGFNGFTGWDFDDNNTHNSNVSAYSISSNVITLTTSGSTLTPGMIIVLGGFTTSTFLNGVTVPVSTATPTVVTAAYTHANAAASEAGGFSNNATPDAPGASITASYVTMNWNGCYEEYPIVDAIPARVCYDGQSGGFGDSWSGQQTSLASFTCDHCVDNYNTKDGFIGPHTFTTNLSITNSTSIGNMGQSWKWGGSPVATTVNFSNNLTVGNCNRLSQPMPGAPANYNQYLSNFCRAAGNVVASSIPTGSTWNITNNTWVTYQPTIFDIACPLYLPCTSTLNVKNNLILGYNNPSNPYGPTVPGVFYIEDGAGHGCGGGVNCQITLNANNNVEYGTRNGSCPGGTGMVCVDPLLAGEPSQTWVSEATLDAFNFNLTSASPAIGAGVNSGVTPDYNGNPRTVPYAIGAVNFTGAAPSGGIKGTVIFTGTITR